MRRRISSWRRLAAGGLIGLGLAALPPWSDWRVPAPAEAPPAGALGVRGLPALDETGTLVGIDADANGVRDDIDRLLRESPLSPLHRLAATRLAMALQQVMVAPPQDADAARQRGRELLDAVVCLASLGAPIRALGSELEGYTFNTAERRAAALASRRHLQPGGLREDGEWHCL